MTAKRCRHDQRPTNWSLNRRRKVGATRPHCSNNNNNNHLEIKHLEATSRHRSFTLQAPGASSSNMLQGKWKNSKKVRSQASDDALRGVRTQVWLLLLSVATRLICFPDWQQSRGSSSHSPSPLSFSFVANNNLLSAAYMICNCFCCDRPQFIISYWNCLSSKRERKREMHQQSIARQCELERGDNSSSESRWRFSHIQIRSSDSCWSGRFAQSSRRRFSISNAPYRIYANLNKIIQSVH